MLIGNEIPSSQFAWWNRNKFLFMFKPKLMRCFLFTSVSNIIDKNMMVQVSVFKFGSFAGILFVLLLFLLHKDSMPKRLVPKTPVEPDQFNKKSFWRYSNHAYMQRQIYAVNSSWPCCHLFQNKKFYFEPETTDLFKIWHYLTSAHSRNIHINLNRKLSAGGHSGYWWSFIKYWMLHSYFYFCIKAHFQAFGVKRFSGERDIQKMFKQWC